MATFKAFKPEAMQRIARSMGHMGDMNQFENFLMANPEKSNMMRNYNAKAMQMAEGGVVKKMQEGGALVGDKTPEQLKKDLEEGGIEGGTIGDGTTPSQPQTQGNIFDDTIGNIKTPDAPEGTTLQPKKIEEKDDQIVDPTKGQVDEDKPPVDTKEGKAKTADDPREVEPETYDPTKVGDAPKAEAEQMTVTEEMKIKAAQGTMSDEEKKAYADALIAGQAQVAKEATVMGQLEKLSAQAEDGQIPSYATAAVRSAMSAMAARGLGASSMASGAVFNAILESQLPIAKQDANTFAQYGLANATNAQQATLAKAAALSSLNMANLSNRQQAVVENAKTFLQVGLANMNNRQQTEIFNTQAQQNFMLSDQAADNAAKQFNAQSKQQADQFMASLASNISQFNASQVNAMEQFNSGEANAMAKFNQQLEDAREQFNASNKLVIEQFNAKWKQQIATTDTAAQNYSNEFNAKALLDISNTAYANMWQHMGDLMEWAWTTGESGKDRLHELSLAEIDAKLQTELAHLDLDAEASASIGGFIVDLFTSPIGGSIVGDYLNIAPIPRGN
tara:strand:+ start:7992 stop:9677 length:1686 start_codon:yes stop_codon:yes gene_type:complete